MKMTLMFSGASSEEDALIEIYSCIFSCLTSFE